MCLTFKKNNKQTKKPFNLLLPDDASAGIRSLQTSIEIKLCQNPWDGLYIDEQVFLLKLASWKSAFAPWTANTLLIISENADHIDCGEGVKKEGMGVKWRNHYY